MLRHVTAMKSTLYEEKWVHSAVSDGRDDNCVESNRWKPNKNKHLQQIDTIATNDLQSTKKTTGIENEIIRSEQRYQQSNDALHAWCHKQNTRKLIVLLIWLESAAKTRAGTSNM